MEFDYSGRKLRIDPTRNYDPKISLESFANNLTNTEIDVVLQTPECLLIGEAKGEADLDGTGNLILVHQLVRQYVMAWMLVVLTGFNKKVIPFVVGVNKEQVQVQFMMDQGWLNPGNILSWKDIKALSNDV